MIRFLEMKVRATPEVVHWEGQTHETDGDE